MNRKPRVFISYAREDAKKVAVLYKKLEVAGIKPWMDREKILGGANWKDSIKQAIKESDAFVFCMSMNSVAKRGVLVEELNLAKEIASGMFSLDIFIIPLKLDRCSVPDELNDRQYIDYYAKDGFQRLENAIRQSYRVKKNNVTNTSATIAIPYKTNEKEIEQTQASNVSKYFVGRADALREFYSIFSYRRQKNIIYYEAGGGLGKSWLLRRIYEDSKFDSENRMVARPIDFSEIKNRTVKGVRELIINILGQKNFAQFRKSEEEQLTAEKMNKASSILAAKKEKADFDFFEDLNDLSANREIVFLFDTFEVVQNTELGRWFIDDFLIKAENLIVVFAGRPTKPLLTLPFKAIRINLAPFDYLETEEFFKRQAARFNYDINLISTENIKKLRDQPGIDGLPLRLELALNYLSTSGDPGLESIISKDLTRQDVEKNLIHFVKSETPSINPVLRDMAILKRRYDREIINYLLKSDENLYEFKSYGQISKKLADHFIVKSNPDGSFTLHDRIQDLVEEHVLTKPSFGINDLIGRQLFDTVVETWYSNRIEQLKADDERRYLLMTEQLGYRLDRADNNAGIETYKEYFTQAVNRNLFSFNELIVNELLAHRHTLENKGYIFLREQAEWLYKQNRFTQAANIFKLLVHEYHETELYFSNLAYWGSCLLLQGRYHEALETLSLGYQNVTDKINDNWLGVFENYFAYIYQALGNWDGAKSSYLKGLSFARSSKNIPLECRLLIQYSEFQALLGEYPEALGHCDAAINLINNKKLNIQYKGEAFLAFAKINRYQGNTSVAEQYYQEAIGIFQANESGQEWICNALQSLGANQYLSGHAARKIPNAKKIAESISFQMSAYQSLSESLRLCREYSLSPYLPECLYRLGRVIAEIGDLRDEVKGFKPLSSQDKVDINNANKSLKIFISKVLNEIDLPEEDFWRTRRKLVFSTPFKDLKQEKNLLGLAQRLCEIGYLEADAKERIHASLESLLEAIRFALRRKKYDEMERYAERVEFSKGIDYQEGLFVALVNITLGDLLFEQTDYASALSKYKEYFPLLVRQKGYGFYRFDRHYDNLVNKINSLPEEKIKKGEWCRELYDSWTIQGLREIYPAIMIRLEGLVNSFKD